MVEVTIIQDRRDGSESYERVTRTLHSVPKFGSKIVLDSSLWEVEELFYIGPKLFVKVSYVYPADQEAYLEPEDYE